MDQAKLEKMLILMKELSDNEQYTVQDLAREHHTTTRTIYRYLDTFHEAGFSVVKKAPGIYSLTTLGKKFVDFSKLVMFSQEEAFLVSNLISSLDNTNSLKKGLSRKLASVYNSTCIADFVTNKATTKQVEALNEAMRTERQVILHGYESGNSHTVSDRLVEPFKFTTNLVDVQAFDVKARKTKTFKISRIHSVEVLREKWQNKFGHYSEGQDVFRMSGEKYIIVKIELSLLAKNLLVEEFPMSAKDIHKTSTGKWILKTAVHDLRGVGRFVIGLADEVKIIKSPELTAYIRGFQEHIDKLVHE